MGSSRAVLCGVLWPDPADEACPGSFVETVREFAEVWARDHLDLVSEESWQRFNGFTKDRGLLDDRLELRGALLDFIADFANWDNSTNEDYLFWARRLTESAHVALGGEPGTRPLVVDPFAGGGSIPLEALRIGADAFASDLNPVAVLLNKVVLEYIPKYGEELAAEVRKWGEWVRERAEEELAEFYPPDPDGATPIAYLWARTITCEGPGCGAEVPLIPSLWLSKRSTRDAYLRLEVDQEARTVDLSVVEGNDGDPGGTTRRGAATCPVCGYTTPVESVRSQLKARHGGAEDARLVAVRRDDPLSGERGYRTATGSDRQAAIVAAEKFAARMSSAPAGFPTEPLPPQGALGFRVQRYGIERWVQLFTPRQALAIETFARYVSNISEHFDDPTRALAIQSCLTMAIARLADYNSSLCGKNPTGGRGLVHTFGLHALHMVWDFMETNPFNEIAANWATGVDAVAGFAEALPRVEGHGAAEQVDAAQLPLPDESAQVVFTDPPYYDAVPYADLSDFFYVWMKRSLPGTTLTSDLLVPKKEEILVDALRDKSHSDFEAALTSAFSEARRIGRYDSLGSVVFAHKSTAGWEAMLQSIVDAGWVVTGSWPIDTERPGRLRAQGSAALASSVHLVVRPRELVDGSLDEGSVGDWRDVLGELPVRIREWLPRLAAEGVVGADAIFACLGPALEIYSKYARVEKASGEVVTLREYLEQVWAAVSREALSMVFQEADATGFEEDARLTAMFLWTLAAGVNGDGNGTAAKAARSGFSLEYDAARKIAQGLGAHLEQMSDVVEVKGETARLLPVTERVRYLFGKDAEVSSGGGSRGSQGSLFEELAEIDPDAGLSGRVSVPSPGETTLDQVHQAMILFGTNQAEALRQFLVDDWVGKYGRFWSLAQALAALYPQGSDERRWVEGVLARKTPLGL